ncbi:MAG: hypothetical protein JO348_06485 [Alphaproteobacteria bacterium]|nr:hypothetical protein [Alphaproteobacteria bacterium]
MEILAAVVIVAFGIVALFRARLPHLALFVIAGLFVLIGVGTIAWTELRYAPGNTQTAPLPISLARPGAYRTPPFRSEFSGEYDIILQFDRNDEIGDFRCYVGEPTFEALCPKQEPELNVAWASVSEGRPIAGGASNWQAWNASQAALNPKDAERQRMQFRAFQLAHADIQNHWPLDVFVGKFNAEKGQAYVVDIHVARAAPNLAKLHPRLIVGLANSATKGLGAIVIGFALLCVFFGSALLLSALRRGTA